MSSSLQKIYKRQNLPWQSSDALALILEPSNKSAHELNEVGAYIWKNINGINNLQTLADFVFNEFDISLQEAQNDVIEFTTILSEKGLITLNE